MLQLGCLLSCNSSDKNYKNHISSVATEELEELQFKHLQSCNRSACWAAIEVLFEELRFEVFVELQLECCLSCNSFDKNYMSRVATEVLELQSKVPAMLQLERYLSCNSYDKNYKNYMKLHLKCLRSCNWSVCPVATRVLIQLQLEVFINCNCSWCIPSCLLNQVV
jgi:hypothetical protein